ETQCAPKGHMVQAFGNVGGSGDWRAFCTKGRTSIPPRDLGRAAPKPARRKNWAVENPPGKNLGAVEIRLEQANAADEAGLFIGGRTDIENAARPDQDAGID